jgi:adenine C2-methylase RlmN of 23S rRNA A2503 and tRNA A37
MHNAGLSGNLTTGEILEQLVHADRLLAEEMLARKEESKNDEENDSAINNSKNNGKKMETSLESVRNVVFMGMGEPLDNYSNVTEACRTMIDNSMWNLAHGRVTVSTVGLISQIRRLTKELPEVSLALSLHAPNQKDREDIVPTASRYPIEGLIDALDNHMMAYLNQKRKRESWRKKSFEADGGIAEEQQRLQIYTAEERMKESSRRRAMIEYVMLKGESSSFKCAHELGKLCENRQLVVNLIPYNATDVKDKLQCPSDEHMLEFRNIVQSYGTFVTIRRTMGADIASACGQLVQQKNKEQDEREALKKQGKGDRDLGGREKAIDIEDVVVGRKSENTDKSNQEMIANTDTITSKTPQKVETSEQKNYDDSRSSWTESHSNNDLDRYSRMLTLAATVSATCFLASSALFLKRKRS